MSTNDVPILSKRRG